MTLTGSPCACCTLTEALDVNRVILSSPNSVPGTAGVATLQGRDLSKSDLPEHTQRQVAEPASVPGRPQSHLGFCTASAVK